jgi:hypothetical protein
LNDFDGGRESGRESERESGRESERESGRESRVYRDGSPYGYNKISQGNANRNPNPISQVRGGRGNDTGDRENRGEDVGRDRGGNRGANIGRDRGHELDESDLGLGLGFSQPDGPGGMDISLGLGFNSSMSGDLMERGERERDREVE